MVFTIDATAVYAGGKWRFIIMIMMMKMMLMTVMKRKERIMVIMGSFTSISVQNSLMVSFYSIIYCFTVPVLIYRLQFTYL